MTKLTTKLSMDQRQALHSAHLSLHEATKLIEGLFQYSKDSRITPADVDDDTSEAIERCRTAIEYLYEAKKPESC